MTLAVWVAVDLALLWPVETRENKYYMDSILKP